MAALSLALAAGPAFAATDVTQTFAELQRRVNDGQFEAAYALGKTLGSMQGDAHFDFLFGVAAINVGRAPEGVLALERHLAAVPGNDRARLELARGYFELGDYVRARQEFEFVLRYNPPNEVRANIGRYLDAMQTRDTLSSRMNSRFYLEAGAGHDSNVNAGTFNTQIILPTGPVTLVNASSRAVASDFFSLAGGGNWVRRVTPPFAVFIGGDFDLKTNQDATQFDTSNVSGYAGFSLVSGAILYRLSMAQASMAVNNTRYRDTLSTTGELQYGVGNGLFLNGVFQYAEQSHTGENSIRDSKTQTFGGGLQKTFNSDWSPMLGVQVSLAKEDNLNRRFDLSREMVTSRVFAAVSPCEKIGLSLSVAEQRSDYLAADIAFNTVRADRLLSVDLGISYSLARNWVLRGEWQWSENESNQGLYAFRRTFGAIKTRYLF